MPQITHVRTESTGTHPKHITFVKLSTGSSQARATVVSEIDGDSYYYYTKGGGQTGVVETVHPSGETPYIRTKGDSTTADNLLKLPSF